MFSLPPSLLFGLNLPHDFEKFHVSSYVEKWLTVGHMRSDEKRYRKKRRYIDDLKEEEDLIDMNEYLDGSTIF